MWEHIDRVHKRTSGSIELCRVVVVVMLADTRWCAVCNVWRTRLAVLSPYFEDKTNVESRESLVYD
jgi:hypothetical protein